MNKFRISGKILLISAIILSILTCKKTYINDGGGDEIPNGVPSGLTAVVISDARIDLATNSTSTNEDGYSWERSPNGGTLWEEISTTGAGVKIYSNTGLTEYTQYYYRVRAFRGSDYSAYSNTVSNRTLYPSVINTNTVAWYDASDLTTITKDEGTGEVSLWIDKLLSGHDLVQVSAKKHPVWSANGILFDGSKDFMKTVPFTWAQPEFIYMVMRQVSWTLYDFILDGDTYESGAIYQENTAPEIYGLITEGGTMSNAAALLNTWIIVRCLFNGSSGKLLVDHAAGSYSITGTTSMAGFTLGSKPSGTSPGNIEVAEIICRNVVDIPADETKIYNYLKTKWGIQEPSVSPFNNGKLVLTFDDGGESLYPAAYPLLVAQGIKGTFYIVTDLAGTGTYITWAQLQIMSGAGMDIECHSKTHTDFTTLTQLQIEAELQAVNDAFATNGLPAPHHHAYPFGNNNLDVRTWVSRLRSTGRIVASPSVIQTNSDKYLLPGEIIDGIDAAGITAIKEQMDAAMTNKTAIMTIAHGVDAGGTYITSANLNSIIDYAQSIGMDIITVSELYNLMDSKRK